MMIYFIALYIRDLHLTSLCRANATVSHNRIEIENIQQPCLTANIVHDRDILLYCRTTLDKQLLSHLQPHRTFLDTIGTVSN